MLLNASHLHCKYMLQAVTEILFIIIHGKISFSYLFIFLITEDVNINNCVYNHNKATTLVES